MSDKGTKLTDKTVDELEKKLQTEYKKAEKEAQKKLDKYLQKFKEEDKKKIELVKKGEMTETEYKQWRLNKITGSKQYKSIVESMAKAYTNAGIEAAGIIAESMIWTFAENYNYSASEISKAAGGIKFDIYDKNTVQSIVKDNPDLLPKPRIDIPKSNRWNVKKINSSLVQGILQGEAIPKIAERLRNVTDMDKNASVRNARTMMTSAQNAGRMESYHKAEEMGIEMEKVWIAALDDRTRESHGEMHGEAVGIDEEFSNGLMYPADPSGEPEEIYNCRCTLIARVKGVDLSI